MTTTSSISCSTATDPSALAVRAQVPSQQAERDQVEHEQQHESPAEKGRVAARRIAHARILLLADEGHADEASPRPWRSAPGPSTASASAWSPKASSPPWITSRSRH